MERLGDPKFRRRIANWLLVITLILWPATHVLVVVLHPPESSWVFHLLLALSWASLVVAFGSLAVTTDVRVQEEDE